ncbi:MAG: mechanosensitive ion channel domain-containing protein [Candidatus Babeliales bacterium]
MKKIVSLLLLMLAPSLGAMSVFFSSEQPVLPFLSTVELRKQQIAELEKESATTKKRCAIAEKLIAKKISMIDDQAAQAQLEVANAGAQDHDHGSKKLTLLNNRKQQLKQTLELWKELQAVLEEHHTHLNVMVTYLKEKDETPSALKPIYSWKEYKEYQDQMTDISAKLTSDKTKKETLKKQKHALTEAITSWQRQLDTKTLEQKNLLEQISLRKGVTTPKIAQGIKLEADLLSQEIESLTEKIDHSKTSLSKNERELSYIEDVIQLQQNKLDDAKALLFTIEARLLLDFNDVDNARKEWMDEAQKALLFKENLDKERIPVKEERDKYTLEHQQIQEKISKLKPSVQSKVDGYLARSHELMSAAQAGMFEKELMVLDARRDLADLLVQEKEVLYRMVELHFILRKNPESVDAHQANFKNKEELTRNALRSLNEKHSEAIAAFETNRTLDKVKATLEEIKDKHSTLFAGRESAYREIIQRYEKAQSFLFQQLLFTQNYLAVNSDLITQQEKITRAYELIVNDLEIRKKTHSIWKRSYKAISPSSLKRSFLEAALFLKTLFWSTPAHLGPHTLISRIGAFSLRDIISLFLFIVFFVVAFFATRRSLVILKQRFSTIVTVNHNRPHFMYVNIMLAFLDFALDHFALLFTWFFLFLHVIFNYRFIFATLAPFVNDPYYGSIFYLLSIPVLVYLAHGLLEQFTLLNKRMSYLFFAEKFQHKLLLLLSSFCYATALLIPLRASFIAFGASPASNFAIIIWAAYSLIMLVVFLLFFSKEDVLNIIPSSSSFFIWCKRKIDKHYYRVFFFVMGLFILCNPYIGYTNLAWFLAFAVPLSVSLFYTLFIVHFYIRTYAVFLFMREDEEDLVDKFEHAKAFYGLLVIFSFLLLAFTAFTILSAIWGLGYTPYDIWHLLADEWVIQLSNARQIGFVEFLTLSIFIAAGLVISSIMDRFVLSKLFDILRSEPGTQNMISRILHYCFVFVAILLGINAVHLGEFLFWIITPLFVGLGISLRDVGADFIGGLLILLERPIEIGNYIQVDGDAKVEGTVHKISARTTTIINSKNYSFIVPNKDIMNKTITNWGHGRFAVGFEVHIRVDHRADPELVKKTLLGVIQSHPLVLRVPGVTVRLENIEENGFYFLTRAFVSARRLKEQWEIAAALRIEIIKTFKEHGIMLSRPERVISSPGTHQKSLDITFDK